MENSRKNHESWRTEIYLDIRKGAGATWHLPLMLHHSKIQLKSELDVAGWLRARNNCLPTRRPPTVCDRSEAAICVQVRAVEGIEEVRAELKPHCFFDREVLLQTQIHIPVAWAARRALSRAVAEAFGCGRQSVWARIKPFV